MKIFGGPPERRRQGRQGLGVEDDAAREGDAFSDEAAKGGLGEAAFDEASDGAAREGLSGYGVVLDV